MFNKFLCTGAILCAATSVAIAQPAPYIGGSIGITANTSVKSLDGNYRGMPFNLFAGYGGVLNQNFYLAGEVFATLGTANFSDSNLLKTSYGYGAAIIPGVMLSDQTLAYARVGILRANFSRPNEMRTGGQFGLGLQTTVTQNIDVRGEYDYVAYQAVGHKFSYSNYFSSSPRADQFTVGLIYKFD